MSNEFQSLADELYRERVLRARRVPAEERIMDGPRLFDYACEITLSGLRHEMPNATAAELRLALRRRLELARRLDQFSAANAHHD